jgi:hypothetical protein
MFSVSTNFDGAGVERFKQSTEEKLRDVRCPDHRQAPRIRFHGSSLHDISISVTGCCAKLMEIANAKIGCVERGPASVPAPREAFPL